MKAARSGVGKTAVLAGRGTEVKERSDEGLMLLAREGDEEAFAELARRYRAPILNFVYRFLGDRETAEDVSQDVFVRLWSNARTYTPKAKFSTFIYHVARNLCIDQLDKRRRLPPIASLGQEITDGDGRSHLLEEEIGDRKRGPHGELMRGELEAEIAAAIDALGDDHRLVFVLTELHGLSYQETARIAGCPVGTVASRKSAALKHLRDRLSVGAGAFAP
jgi:RNA polymerase sigma-70 factor (ECF subfamily)